MTPRPRNLAAAVAACAATLALTACTSAAGSDAAGPDAAEPSDGAGKSAKILVIAPLTGSDAGRGLSVRNAVQLAVKEANAAGTVPGWTLNVEAIDDKGEKASAKAAAEKAAADDEVVAVVGSIYSGLTKELQPVLDQAGIPTVSPSATNPTLTKGDAYTTKPTRAYPSFFRVVAPDDAHGPAVARYLTEQRVSRVATVDDGDSYGAGLVEAFTAAYRGKVVSHDTLKPGAGDYRPLAAKIAKAKPQAVFFGGVDTDGGPLSLQTKQAGLVVPLAGGDGIATSTYVPLSGPISAGDISTAAGKPIETVDNGKKYLADYRAAGFPEASTSYAPLAHDAANAVVRALSTSLGSSVTAPKDGRAATIEALAKVSFDGTSGKVAFDAYGDVTPRVVTVNRLQRGGWIPAATYNF